MITQNTHFALATHVLAVLALQGGTLSSPQLAVRVGTNAAFLRGVLGRLQEAGLVASKKGKGGGTRLARDAAQITLLDVFRATDGRVRVMHHDCSSARCTMAAGVPEVLTRLDARLDAALARELRALTVAEVATELGDI